MKAERHSRERDRIRALHSFGILDTAPEALFDELVFLARELLDVPVVLVSLVDEHRQWFKARIGFDTCQTPLEESFCAHAILGDEILVITDATRDPRFADNPLVVSPAAGKPVRFYAGAPLITTDGLPLGTFCVLDHRPRRFGARKRRNLLLLRDQAMALLERHRLQAESERRVGLIGEFLAHVSHEIRTPLSAMLGYAELLGGTLERAEDRAATDTILRNGEHLRLIVDDLLDLSQIEAGRMVMNDAPCAPERLLSDIDAMVRHQALEKGVGWRVECSTALPLEIRTDALRLRQILINMVGNAVKFTEAGEVVLAVTLTSGPGSVPDIEFAVRDTGIGMSPEQLARVFKRFVQAEDDTSSRFGGSGLGLTISRELARLLGGELLVDSQPDVGSVFRLRVPCVPVGDEYRVPVLDAASTGSGSVSDGNPGAALEGLHLLVVDDREDIRRLAERTLERAGAEVLGAGDGAQALALLERRAKGGDRPFDALVLDMQMPVLDGFGVLAALRDVGNEIPVLALTADALLGQRERCIAAGCRGYVSKPFTARELVEAVAALCPREGTIAPTEETSAGTKVPAPGPSNGAPHVLIVDDSRDLTDALGRLLSRQGYRVDAAGSAKAALALVERETPDCIVLDRELPDMHSPELLARLRDRDTLQRTRFLSLSGRAMNDTEREALGFDAYLQKPARLNMLLATIRQLLEDRTA